MRFVLKIFVVLWFVPLMCCASSHAAREITYEVNFDSLNGIAKVEIRVPKNHWLKRLAFDTARRRIQKISSDGEIIQKGTRVEWIPTLGRAAVLNYEVVITKERAQQGKPPSYGAYRAADWLIMRADDLVPPFKYRIKKGPHAKALMQVHLPQSWRSVYAGYIRNEESAFIIKDSRKVPRPTGWIIAGKELVARHQLIGDTSLSFVGPMGQDVRPMELLAMTGVIWPELTSIFAGFLPDKLLIVSANDPMWRGGLSAKNSLFLHASRPLISENATSTLIHELFHVLSGIHSVQNQDWITEGLAEFYSVKLLQRVGAYTDERVEETFSDLALWGSGAKLMTDRSSGATTAKAAKVFHDLDLEIVAVTAGAKNLDHLVKLNIRNHKISIETLQAQYIEAFGKPSKILTDIIAPG